MPARGDIRQSQGDWQSYWDGAWHDANSGLVSLLNNMGVTNVTGSGNAMRFHYTSGAGGQYESTGVLNFQQFLEARERVKEQAQLAPTPTPSGGFEELWDKNMGELPYPDFAIIDPETNQPQPGTVDPSKVLDAVRAYEAVNGPLPGGGQAQLVPLGGDYDQDIVISAEGGVTKIDKAKPAAPVTPGKLITDPKKMIQYFQQPDGSLTQVDTPSTDDLINQRLIQGNTDAAVDLANFRDRPTSLEYFNAAKEWARSPADVFTISAIVRGVFEPKPGPMGELRRVGAPPSWMKDAWVALQKSAGISNDQLTADPNSDPGTVDSVTADNISGAMGVTPIAEANSSPITTDGKTVVSPWGTGETGLEPEITPTPQPEIAPASTSMWDTGESGFESVIEEDDDFWDFPGRGEGGIPKLQRDFESVRDEFNAMFGGPNAWSLDNPTGTRFGNYYTPADEFLAGSGLASGGATIQAMLDAMMAEMDDPEGDGQLETNEVEVILDVEGNMVGDVNADGDDQGLDIQEGDSAEEVLDILEDVSPWATGESGFEEAMAPSLIDYGGFDPYADVATAPAYDDTDDWAPSGPVRSFEELLAESRGNIFDPMFRDTPPSTAGFDSRTEGYPQDWLTGPEEVGYRVGTNISTPRPGAQQSDMQPWERARAIDAFELDPWGGGLDFIPDEFISPTSRTLGEIMPRSGTVTAEDRQARQEAIAESQRDAAMREQLQEIASTPQFYDIPGYGPYDRPIDPGQAETMYSPYEYEESAPITPVYDDPEPETFEPVYEPTPFEMAPAFVEEPAPVEVFEPPETWGAPVVAPEDMAGRWYDEGEEGIRTRDRMALVGESGPEIALFPNGTEIIPLDRKMKPDQARRLRRRGKFAKAIDSFEFGGFVGDMGPEVTDLPPGAQVMPAGITEMMTGRPTRRPRSLMRQAGMRAPSAQTISNLLPEEIEVYQEMGRLAGIPEKAFEREFRSMVPMGQGGTRQARFTPRGTGRTRYGSI